MNEEERENVCSICLSKIRNNPNSDSDSLYKLKENNSNKNEDRSIEIFLTNIKLSFIKYFKKPIIKTPCGHIFHSTCLELSLNSNNKCPICRREIYKN